MIISMDGFVAERMTLWWSEVLTVFSYARPRLLAAQEP